MLSPEPHTGPFLFLFLSLLSMAPFSLLFKYMHMFTKWRNIHFHIRKKHHFGPLLAFWLFRYFLLSCTKPWKSCLYSLIHFSAIYASTLFRAPLPLLHPHGLLQWSPVSSLLAKPMGIFLSSCYWTPQHIWDCRLLCLSWNTPLWASVWSNFPCFLLALGLIHLSVLG